VVIGDEPACLEVAGGHATAMHERTPAALADAVAAAVTLPPAEVAAAREHAARFTWARTVEQTRALLARLDAQPQMPSVPT
jgi:hypothetical protein